MSIIQGCKLKFCHGENSVGLEKKSDRNRRQTFGDNSEIPNVTGKD